MSSVTGSVLPSLTAKAVALSLVSLPNSYLTFNLPLRNNALSILLISAIKECYDVVIAPTYGLGSALAAVFMKIHGRAPHRATFRSDYYAVDLPEGREWSDAESKGKIESISKGKPIDYWATQHNLLKLFPDAVHIRWGDDYFLFTDEYIIDLSGPRNF